MVYTGYGYEHDMDRCVCPGLGNTTGPCPLSNTGFGVGPWWASEKQCRELSRVEENMPWRGRDTSSPGSHTPLGQISARNTMYMNNFQDAGSSNTDQLPNAISHKINIGYGTTPDSMLKTIWLNDRRVRIRMLILRASDLSRRSSANGKTMTFCQYHHQQAHAL